MSMGMRARMATMRMCMRRKKQSMPMMDQHRMCRTDSIVLESVKIEQYISDQYNTIMVKKMRWQSCIRSEASIALSDNISKLNIYGESATCNIRQ